MPSREAKSAIKAPFLEWKGQSLWYPRKSKAPKNLRCPSAYNQLRQRCLAPLREFYPLGDAADTPNGKYVYCDNDASILAVAHLDTVLTGPRHFGSKKGKADRIYNAQLDDRLGVYTILDVLPSMGIHVDVLLTEGEELSQSTAEYFQPDKEYNWIVEFDRGGTDVVMYNYETTKLRAILKETGSRVGVGTYSDIYVMEELGVAAFNWGIGYHDHHFMDCYFSIAEYNYALQRFGAFYTAYKDQKLEHTPCLSKWDYSDYRDHDAPQDKWIESSPGSGRWKLVYPEEMTSVREEWDRQEDYWEREERERIENLERMRMGELWERKEHQEAWDRYEEEHRTCNRTYDPSAFHLNT